MRYTDVIFQANQNKLHVQVKHKLGAFHQAGPLIGYLNACFYGNQQQGGGGRGGRGQRGGYQGQGGGDGGGDITRNRQFFSRGKKRQKCYWFLEGSYGKQSFILTSSSCVFYSCSINYTIEVGCVVPMIVVSKLLHAEFGRNDHQEYAPHFTF